MRISRGFFILAGGLFFFSLFVFFRYYTLGYDFESIAIAFTVFFTAISILFFSSLKFRDPINPVSIYFLFLILFGYSIIPLSSFQSKYSVNTYWVIILSAISYFVPIGLNIAISNVKLIVLSINQRKSLLYFLLSMSVITFVLECISFGYIPFLKMFSYDIYSDTNSKLIPFLHYFIVLNSFIPCWAYLFRKKDILSTRQYHVILLISLFILMNYLSRQVYLLLGISFFMAYSYYHKIKLFSLIKVVGIVVLLFILIGFLKFHSSATDSFSEFMLIIAGIDDDRITILESTLVEYSSKRFFALNEIVNARDAMDYYGMGIYTFRPLLSFFLLEKMGVVNRIPELDSEILVTTYAADPYLDFGLLGVILLNFIYGSFALGCYNNFKNRNDVAVVSWSIVIFCCIMTMFINYFNTMLIWLGLIFNQILFYKIEKIK